MSATSGERKNPMTNQAAGSRPFSQATQAVTAAPPIQIPTPHSVKRNPSLTSSPTSSSMARLSSASGLAPDAQQEQDHDQAQRNSEQPAKDQRHVTSLPCRSERAASGSR